MVDFSVRWEVVNGMPAARARGYGEVTRYLARMGVARSSAYRWELRLRWLVEFGPTELRQLRRERDALYVQLRELLEGAGRVEGMSRAEERRFILHMAVLGNSDAEIAALLATVGGRRLSHETIRATINEAAALARVAFGRHFCGVGTVAAVDEIFLGNRPLLLAVEPTSLLISGLRLGEGRSAEDWRPVFESFADLRSCLADGGRGIGKAAGGAGVDLHRDMWHLLRPARAAVGPLWRRCEKAFEAEMEARQAYEAIRHTETKGATNSARHRYYHARRACNEALEECTRLDDLLNRVEEAFDYTTPEGKVNTAQRAEGIVAEVLEALDAPSRAKQKTPTNEAKRFADALRTIVRARAFAYLDVLAGVLSHLEAGALGPEPEVTLGRLVAETVAWRRRDKEPVAILEAASDGRVADQVEIAVIKAVDLAGRSSSSVECVNARVRTVQVARKRVSEDFAYLLAVYHNMKAFGRGSVREGKTPAELSGIALPTDDWIELLDLTRADESAQAAVEAA